MAASTTIKIRAEDKTKQAFRNVTERTQKLKSSFGGLATAAVGLAGAAGLGALTARLLTLGDRIGKVSSQVGISAESLQKFQFAAEQSGVGAEAMNKALQKLNRNIGEASTGTGPAADALEQLGLSAVTSSGQIKSTETIFGEVAGALSQVESDAIKASIASDLFGRAGVELLPLLNSGAGAVEEFGNQITAVGGVISEEGIVQIQAYNDQLNLLSKSFQGFLVDSGFIKTMTTVAEGAVLKIGELNDLFGDQEKTIRKIDKVSEDLRITRMETALFQDQIKKSSGEEKEIAIKRLKENQKQIKELEKELDSAKQIEKQVAKQEKAQKQVKKGVEATDKVAKKLVKTVKPLMIAGKLDIPAIGGRQGLGGTLEQFTEFYLNLMVLAEDYLGPNFGVSGIVDKHLSTVAQDFSELVIGMENQLVFRRNDISYAFGRILDEIENQLKNMEVEDIFNLDNTFVYVPGEIFDFSQAEVEVPTSIFDFDEKLILQAKDVLDVEGKVVVKVEDKTNIDWDQLNRETTTNVRSLVNRMNDVEVMNSYGGYSPVYVGGARDEYYGYGYHRPKIGNPDYMENFRADYLHEGASVIGMPPVGDTQTNYTGNYLKSNSVRSGAAPISRSAGREATNIEVNIFDGTGQKISDYDSSIRVEINERASRNDQFPALAA